jgi:hypothetical protein
MLRRPIIHITTGDQLRDYIIELLDSDEPMPAGAHRKMMARAIARYWSTDPKDLPKSAKTRDRHIARYRKARATRLRIDELRADDPSLTMEDARDRLHARGAGAALYKWLRRNRRPPDL